MAKTRQQMIDILAAKYPEMHLRTTEEFSGSKGGIWTSGEDELVAKDGHRLFDSDCDDYNEIRYIIGTHKEIYNLLEKHGWYAEWYDAGTVMLWLI